MRPWLVAEPGTLILSAESAALLEVRLQLHLVREKCRLRDPKLHQLLLGIHVAAMSHVEQCHAELGLSTSAEAGSGIPEVAEAPAPLALMSASQVASKVGCTPRAVRLAASEGRLIGTKDDRGCWSFTPHDVAIWVASSPRKAA